MSKSIRSVYLVWRKGIPGITLAFVLALAGSMLALAANAADDTQNQAVVQVDNRVNINTADAETLALALDGVGMSRAQDIIAYREQHGEFTEVDQLIRVRGIGPATLERNRDRILLKDPSD
jgi:competence protein ComEA